MQARTSRELHRAHRGSGGRAVGRFNQEETEAYMWAMIPTEPPTKRKRKKTRPDVKRH